MEQTSKYIEAKRLYYSNLQEMYKLTDEENKAHEAHLTFSKELSIWLSTKSHSIDQCLSLWESYLYMNIAGKVFSDKLTEENKELIDDDYKLYKCIKEFQEQPNKGIEYKPLLEEKAGKGIKEFADYYGVTPTELPEAIIFSGDFMYSFLHPCARTFRYIFEYKKFFQKYKDDIHAFETEFYKILGSDADNEIKQECISDLQFDIFGISTFEEDLWHIESVASNIEKDYIKSINAILYSIVQLILTCTKSGIFSRRETEVIGNILNQSFIKEDIDRVRTEILQYEQNSEVFILPKDYFLKSVSGRPEEYLSGCHFGINTDVGKFMDLINYLGDEGYIDNNKTTKELLAYRLTGRLRPEIEGDLPKIVWNGNGAHGSSCIYLIGSICDAKNKFKSMKCFFDAEFPDNKPSSIAYSCPKAFREYLHELFPKIFKLKNSEQ